MQFTVWSYAVLLSGYHCWGRLNGPRVPTAWWRGARRWSFMTLWRAFRVALWLTLTAQPTWSPTNSNWPASHAAPSALSNAILATSKG